MVLVMGVLAVLAVLAMVVLNIVTTEKRTTFTEYTNNRSFYSADAAGEAGVAWIRRQGSPPALMDSLNHVSVATGYTALSNDHRYQFDVRFVQQRFRPGWSAEYLDYEYVVEARGASSQQSEAAVELGAVRVFREGY
jgi:Tfp pilus assembly protein PilX